MNLLHSISYLTDTAKADHESVTQQLDTPKIVRPAKSQSPSRVRLQLNLADSGMRSILHPLLSLHTRLATLSLYRTLGKQKTLKCRQLRHLPTLSIRSTSVNGRTAMANYIIWKLSESMSSVTGHNSTEIPNVYGRAVVRPKLLELLTANDGVGATHEWTARGSLCVGIGRWTFDLSIR